MLISVKGFQWKMELKNIKMETFKRTELKN